MILAHDPFPHVLEVEFLTGSPVEFFIKKEPGKATKTGAKYEFTSRIASLTSIVDEHRFGNQTKTILKRTPSRSLLSFTVDNPGLFTGKFNETWRHAVRNPRMKTDDCERVSLLEGYRSIYDADITSRCLIQFITDDWIDGNKDLTVKNLQPILHDKYFATDPWTDELFLLIRDSWKYPASTMNQSFLKEFNGEPNRFSPSFVTRIVSDSISSWKDGTVNFNDTMINETMLTVSGNSPDGYCPPTWCTEEMDRFYSTIARAICPLPAAAKKRIESSLPRFPVRCL